MRLRLMCPTRSRANSIKSLCDTIKKTISGTTDTRLCIGIDLDDPKREEVIQVALQYTFTDIYDLPAYGKFPGVSTLWNDLCERVYQKEKYDAWQMVGDDFLYNTKNWDVKMIEEINKYKDGIYFLYFEDGINHAKIAVNPVVPVKLKEILGYYVRDGYMIDAIDYDLQLLMQMVGRSRYMGNVYIKHNHVCITKQTDETHQNMRASYRKPVFDEVAVYDEKRIEEAKKIKQYIEDTKTTTTQEIFAEICHNNKWGDKESVSGSGSNLAQTETLRKELSLFFKSNNVMSIVDAPCGDCNWIPLILNDNINYMGYDIVPDVLQIAWRNMEKHRKNNVKLNVGNIITDVLPAADMIICRDCLVHLDFASIQKALNNFKLSGCKYFATTYFPNTKNQDITIGGWRQLDICGAPFNFPKPRWIIDEKLKGFKKCLAIWDMDELRLK